jgi:hypothetical protein
MKSLIYSSALLCVLLSVASCNKNEAVQPQKDLTLAPASTDCNSTNPVNYVLTNLTGDATYEIAFSGAQNYTFSFPANGSKTITVKPGAYNVFIYSPGNYTEHNIFLDASEPVRESGARVDNFTVSSCNIAHTIKIDQ